MFSVLSDSVIRFLTRDPYPAYASVPSTLHRYAYVGNNPVNRVDPSGLRWAAPKAQQLRRNPLEMAGLARVRAMNASARSAGRIGGPARAASLSYRPGMAGGGGLSRAGFGGYRTSGVRMLPKPNAPPYDATQAARRHRDAANEITADAQRRGLGKRPSDCALDWYEAQQAKRAAADAIADEYGSMSAAERKAARQKLQEQYQKLDQRWGQHVARKKGFFAGLLDALKPGEIVPYLWREAPGVADAVAAWGKQQVDYTVAQVRETVRAIREEGEWRPLISLGVSVATSMIVGGITMLNPGVGLVIAAPLSIAVNTMVNALLYPSSAQGFWSELGGNVAAEAAETFGEAAGAALLGPVGGFLGAAVGGGVGQILSNTITGRPWDEGLLYSIAMTAAFEGVGTAMGAAVGGLSRARSGPDMEMDVRRPRGMGDAADIYIQREGGELRRGYAYAPDVDSSARPVGVDDADSGRLRSVDGVDLSMADKARGLGTEDTMRGMPDPDDPYKYQVSRDWVLKELKRGSTYSRNIADLIERGEIGLNVLGEDLFAYKHRQKYGYTPTSRDRGFIDGDQLYLRATKITAAEIPAKIVHEATHLLDIDNATVFHREMLAYTREAEFVESRNRNLPDAPKLRSLGYDLLTEGGYSRLGQFVMEAYAPHPYAPEPNVLRRKLQQFEYPEPAIERVLLSADPEMHDIHRAVLSYDRPGWFPGILDDPGRIRWLLTTSGKPDPTIERYFRYLELLRSTGRERERS